MVAASTEYERVVHSTIANYIRKREVNIMRKRRILALMQEKGRVSMNNSGERLNWKVEFKENSIQVYADGATQTWPRFNRDTTAELDWRGYSMPEAVTKKERLMNKGKEAIINIWSTMTERMMNNFSNDFGDEFFIDGNDPANDGRIHGLESFMGDDGVASTLLPIGDSSDTYAGLSTALAGAGGSWTGTWPQGQGDAQYDYWTPLLVDYTSAVATASGGWEAVTKTWPNTCIEALRFSILYTQKNRSVDDQLDMFLGTADLYRGIESNMDSKERILVRRDGETSKLVKLGFQNVLNIDGVDVTWEYAVPSNTMYGLNIDYMELHSLQPQLLVNEGPYYDESTKSWRFSIDFFGNLRCNPRNFSKLKNYS